MHLKGGVGFSAGSSSPSTPSPEHADALRPQYAADFQPVPELLQVKGTTLNPEQADVDGFNTYIGQYKALLDVERKAVEVL